MPTFYGNDEGYKESGYWGTDDYSGTENTTNVRLCWNNANDDARSIVTSGYSLYNIFAYGEGSGYLKALTNNAYTGSGSYNSTSTMTYSDGSKTTDYFYDASNTDKLVEAFNAIIEKINNSVSYINVELDDPVTSMTNVSTSTDTGGNKVTDFAYYRSGGKNEDNTEKYDSTANGGLGVKWNDAPAASMENGKVKWDLGDLQLENGVTYTVTFVVWPSQEALDLVADLNNGIKTYDSLTADQKVQIVKSGNTYSLRTNENGDDNDSRPTVTYSTITTKTSTAGGEPEVVVSEPVTAPIANPDPVGLGFEEFTVKKVWNNDLDGRSSDSVDLIVTKDEANYLYGDNAVTVASPDWVIKTVYISCGLMTVKNGVVDIKEEGHDYTVIEPADYAYYWDLTADVYHPMVINGVNTMLILDDEATGTDGTDYYTIKGHKYVESDADSNQLTATNDRRSCLNLTKVVDVANTPDDDTFEYTATFGEAGEDDIWFSVRDAANAYVTDLTTSATPEDGNTGYYYVAAGTEFTFEIAKDWNVRFINLPTGTAFSIEETDMPALYSFVKTEAEASATEESWNTITEELITGTIVEPNNQYDITYTNTCQKFYVYHSGVAGDGNLEIIPMTEVKSDGTYDLYAKTTAGTLYGGYYLDYAGKGDYKDDGVAGTTGVAYTGMNYNWSSPETTIGTAMKPVAEETYYIKEVPTYYRRNYHQITYVKATQVLKSLYLISAIDDLNYQETGFVLTNGTEKAKVVSTLTYKNWTTGKTATLKANTVFKKVDGKAAITQAGEYLTYFDATSSDYFAAGTFTVLPYWITPDGITVNGISTRTITIKSDADGNLIKTGMSKSDS